MDEPQGTAVPAEQGSIGAAPTDAPIDISKTTIVVLVLVTLMISVIGTWTVLNELNTVKTVSPKGADSGGRVYLNIQQSGVETQASTTGRVALEIVQS